jgi:hypothetical protein
MDNTAPFVLTAIDEAILTPVVRQSLGRHSIKINDWRVSQLGGGAGNPVSVGLFRFEGIGQDHAERLPWSVILKVIQSPANVGWQNMGEGDDPSHWNYWKREVRLYPSGLLDDLPAGLAVPRCFGTAELPGNTAWLWLEDIHDANNDGWPLERYALTARHLGRLNAYFLTTRPLPTFDWLDRRRMKQWVDSMPNGEDYPWTHPRVLERYPRPDADPFRHMLLDSHRYLAALERLPHTLSHGDTYPSNFKSRREGDQELTVALDWAMAGIEPLGDDLGQFVFGAQNNLPDQPPEVVCETLFDAYIEGLRDCGWQGDTYQVRFGFAASAALRVGLFQMILLAEEIKQGNQATIEPGGRQHVPECFEVTMARQARTWLEKIA